MLPVAALEPAALLRKCHGIAEGLDDALDVGIGVRHGHEAGAAFPDVEAVRAQKEEEDVAVGLVGGVFRLPQRGEVCDMHRRAGLLEVGVDDVHHLLGAPCEPALLAGLVAQVFEAGLHARQDDGMTHEGAGKIGHTRLGHRVVAILPVAAVEGVHEARDAGNGPDRQAAAEDLAIGADVGLHAKVFLRAAGCRAKAGDDFVHDHRRAAVAGDAPHLVQKLARLPVGAA